MQLIQYRTIQQITNKKVFNMAITTQSQTIVKGQVKVGKTSTAKALSDKILGGRALGSPINGKKEGEEFQVTLTGVIEIREFNKVLGAYYLTKEGYSIKVNASFDPAKHKADEVFTAVCRVFPREDGGQVKFFTFVD